MKIYLSQHAVAVPEDQEATRPISDSGAADTVKIAVHLARQGIEINKICHSGKLRARQTAEIFAEHLLVTQTVEASGMNPNDNVVEFAADLNEDGVMYVGHLPHLGRLSSLLCSGSQDNEVLQFQNSAVACVEFEPDRGVLLWYIVPSIC